MSGPQRPSLTDFFISSSQSLQLHRPPKNGLPMLAARKLRHRFSLLGILALIFLSTYAFFMRWPAFTREHPFGDADSYPTAGDNAVQDSSRHTRQAVVAASISSRPSKARPQIRLDRVQELAAISSFLTSLTPVVVPPFVDPTMPIDPQLVLDFDTTSPRASSEVETMIQDVWARNPVLLYSKRYSPASRAIKGILDSLQLSPPSTIIEVDEREDAEILEPMLERLTASKLPLLLIGGKPLASLELISTYHKSGELQRLVREAGAVLNGARDRKHRQ